MTNGTEPSAPRRRAVAALDRPPHQQQPLIGAGHRALHQEQVALRVDAHDPEVLDRHAVVAHAPGHPLALEDATRRRGRADRAGRAPAVGLAAGLRAAGEAVALDHTREALALGGAGHVDQVADLEEVGLGRLPHLLGLRAVVLHLAQVARLRAARLEVAALRLVQPLLVAEAELHGAVAVLL